jgi:hypothetical protein
MYACACYKDPAESYPGSGPQPKEVRRENASDSSAGTAGLLRYEDPTDYLFCVCKEEEDRRAESKEIRACTQGATLPGTENPAC